MEVDSGRKSLSFLPPRLGGDAGDFPSFRRTQRASPLLAALRGAGARSVHVGHGWLVEVGEGLLNNLERAGVDVARKLRPTGGISGHVARTVKRVVCIRHRSICTLDHYPESINSCSSGAPSVLVPNRFRADRGLPPADCRLAGSAASGCGMASPLRCVVDAATCFRQNCLAQRHTCEFLLSLMSARLLGMLSGPPLSWKSWAFAVVN